MHSIDAGTARCGPPEARQRRGWMHRLSGFAACVAAVSALAAEPAATAPASAPASPWVHRPLRQNVEPIAKEPTTPEAFSGYPGAPAFDVVPEKDKLTFYPCMQCHQAMKPNPQPRKLASPHPAALAHGKGRIWCLDCHQIDDRNSLHTIRGEKVDFNDAYLICGQCHFNRQKDWYFGAHGKRAVNWQGKRTLFNCTHCHDPHDPLVKPRAPSKAPPVRAELKPMLPAERHHGTAWERTAQTESRNGQ